jgi:5,10-methylene-tetrahydrofolate dehydrogenase/methenyl tetrahydrofolate cyclohydrolase
MLRPISNRASAAEIIEKIYQLHQQRRLHRILVNFPLPEKRGKLKADK